MRRTAIALEIVLLIIVFASPVFALKTIRINPPYPTMVSSPATFSISVTQHPADDPLILLVMTKACYNGLTSEVTVTWSGGSTSFAVANFTAVNTGTVPPSMPAADYEVASLQDHLGVLHSEDVYYAYGPFLAGSITQTPQTFTVTLPSTAPKMLVYAIGKSSTTYDNSVPNSIPGFETPEPTTILLALASFSALGLYAFKRRGTQK